MFKEERIIDLIKAYPYLARKKKALINAIWQQDMDTANLPKPWTYADFIDAYKQNKITDAETITRALRKIIEAEYKKNPNSKLDPDYRKRKGQAQSVREIFRGEKAWQNK